MFHIIFTKSSKAPASLTLNSLLIYSKLSFATHAVPTPMLARWSGLSEREVDLCLAELSAIGLIYCDCGGAAAIEPPLGWFVPRRNFKKESWPYRIAYWTYFPSTTGKLTADEAAAWSHIFTSNNVSQIVPNLYISQATGIPEPKVAKTVAALVREGLVREQNGFRLAHYDARYGQVLDKGATATAIERCCVGNAKDKGSHGSKDAGNVPTDSTAPQTMPPELKNLEDYGLDSGS
jgi:hypothetical protein